MSGGGNMEVPHPALNNDNDGNGSNGKCLRNKERETEVSKAELSSELNKDPVILIETQS